MADKVLKLSLDAEDVKKEAKAGAAALDEISRKLKMLRATTVTPKVELGPLQKAAAFVKQIKEGLGTKIGGASIGAGLAAGAKALAASAAAITAAITATGLALGIAGAKFAVGASDFRGETEGAFAKILGSSKAASALYEKVMNAAQATGLSQEAAVKRSMGLLNAGFKFSQIEPLIRLFADIEKVKGEGGSEGFAGVLQKALASGKFDSKSINALAKQGVSTAAIYDQLAKQLGKSRAEVVALFQKIDSGGKKGKGGKSGKPAGVSADEGIKAAIAVLQKRLGGVAAADSFGDLWMGIKVGFARLFDKVDTSGLTKVMAQWIKILQGPEGAALKGGVTALFTEIFNAIGALLGGGNTAKAKSGIAGLAAAMHNMAAGIKQVTPHLANLSSGISSVAANAAKLQTIGKGFFDAIMGSTAVAKVNGMARALLTIGEMFGLVSKKDASGLRSQLDAIDKVSKSPIGDQLRKLTGEGMFGGEPAANTNAVGTNMALGIQQGIESGKAGIVSSLVSACQAAVASAKSTLSIQSPSRVFFGIGAMTAAGMAGGIAAGRSMVANAAQSIGAGATAAANSNAYRATGTGGFGASGVGSAPGAAGNTIHLTTNYHPPQVAVNGGNPADTQAHTEAASVGAMTAFQGHLTDVLRRVHDT